MILKMNRYIKIICLICILIVSNYLSGEPIEVFISEEQGYVGDTLLIPVQVDSLTKSDSVLSYNCKLSYDQSILRIVGIETQNSLSKNTLTTANINTGEIIIAMASSEIISGYKPLIYLKAKGIESGTSRLSWTRFLFNDGNPEVNATGSIFNVITSSVDKVRNKIIEDYKLCKIFPNPFNSSVSIKYQMQSPGFVDLTIYDLKGEKVRQIVEDYNSAGKHTAVWNGIDINHDKVSSGVYFVKIRIDNYVDTQKILFAK